MLPRERLIKAMELKHPDRVPSMSQFSIGFMNHQLKDKDISPMELWLDAEKYAEALLFLREKFDFDGILVSIHGHDPHWKDKVRKIETENGYEKAVFNDREEIYPEDDLPLFRFHGHPREVSLEDPNILSYIPKKVNYVPASRESHFFISDDNPYRIFQILNDETRGRFSIHGEVTSPLDYFLNFLGYENALTCMMIYPDTCEAILQKFTDGIVEMADGICSQDIDAVKISSPFAGMGFISPEMYRTFELPYLSQIVRAIHEAGKFSYIHTCGKINDRLEMLGQSRATGLECLDPPPIGNVKLDEAFSRIGNRMFIKGNIDSVNTLLKANDDQIRQDIFNRLQTGMRYRGFILSTACSIAPGVKAEKVRMITQMAEKYGVYTN